MQADYGAAGSPRGRLRRPGGTSGGVLVIYPENGALLIENVAACPTISAGNRRRLDGVCRTQARAAGLRRNPAYYTNALMTENIAFYERLGYVEF